MVKFVFEQPWTEWKVDTEDGGMAKIYHVTKDGEAERLFVRVQSWDELGLHPEFEKLRGKRIRVTVETIDDQECN